MNDNSKKQYNIAMKVWDLEHKLLDNIQQLPNKGNYLIWRKSLLMKKASDNKLASEGSNSRLAAYLAHRSKQLSKKNLTTSMKKSRSADSLEEMGLGFVRGHHRRTSSDMRSGHGHSKSISTSPSPNKLDFDTLTSPRDGEVSPRALGPKRGKAYYKEKLRRQSGKLPRPLTSGDLSIGDSASELMATGRKRATSLEGSKRPVFDDLASAEKRIGHSRSQSLHIDGGRKPPGERNRDSVVLLTQTSKVAEMFEFAGMHHIFMEHEKPVTNVRWGNNEKNLLAFSSMDGNISICNGLINPQVIRTLRGHTEAVLDFVWSLANDVIVSGSTDKTCRVWKVTGESLHIIRDGAVVSCCRFHPTNPKIFFYATYKGLVKRANVSDGNVTAKIKLENALRCMEFSTSGNSLFVGDIKGIVYTIQFDKSDNMKLVAKAAVSPKVVNSITFKASTPKTAPYLLFSCADNTLKLYKVESKITSGNHLTLLQTMPVPNSKEWIRSRFCPLPGTDTATCVVSGSEDMSVYIYDTMRPDGKSVCINQLQGHSATVYDVAWNVDESLLASCDATGMVILWKRVKEVITEEDPS